MSESVHLHGMIERRHLYAVTAACAGSAEAGWRATIAAIEVVKWSFENSGHAHKSLAAIIAAWPEELL